MSRIKVVRSSFLGSVQEILETARNRAKEAVDLSMVYAYFEVGRMICEEELNGKSRAEYGKYVILELSKYLTSHLGKGFSETNLKQMRFFFQVYSREPIRQIMSDELKNLPTTSTGRKFVLSWSHFQSSSRAWRCRQSD